MIRLTIQRPNTIGVTYEAEFECAADVEEFVNGHVAKFETGGWEACRELGMVELNHDYAADVILIQWETV